MRLKRRSFISCDWGTSFFRLRWVDPELKVRREFREASGCKLLYQRAPDPARRSSLYEATLRKGLAAFNELAGTSVPLVISGMASSTIGWREIPYLAEPLRIDGSNLRFEMIDWPGPNWLGPTYLISGVALDGEMMRGEETEAVGILGSMPREDLTLILPGTHSKHLEVCDGRIARIFTYMTGELYEVLSTHSILSASIDRSRSEPPGASFEEGVRRAREAGLARGLFRTRTRAVLDQHPAAENAGFLSGLLIGSELCDLAASGRKLWIAGTPALRDLYVRALKCFDLPDAAWGEVPQKVIELAVPAAQAGLLAAKPV